MSKNLNLFPSIERYAKAENIVSFGIRNCGNDLYDFCDNPQNEIPYFKNLMEEIEKCNTSLNNVIIATSSEPVAVKCAKLLLDHEEEFLKRRKIVNEQEDTDPYGIYDEEFDDDDIDYDFSYEDEETDTLKLVRLPKNGMNKDVPINVYLKLLEEIESDAVIYEGVEHREADNADIVNAILADKRKRKYVWIPPEMVEDAWVTSLRMENSFAFIKIEDVPKSYYETVFEALLSNTEYELQSDVTVANVVNNIMKLRGKLFAEEDLQWIIQNAIHKKELEDDDHKILSMEDFVLNGKLEKPALERLEAMPGLKEVKDMVIEQTALLVESRRNENLKNMHGSMIFYGNPGTGKTTCARLLAEVMKDHGVTNATFIEASRADIIGEYVGSTATKVASLFEKARGGILFVDEAGFFLNEGAGGYVNEALKEFVRFMENCPDVTVIFGMYEQEAEKFLNLDAGLTSRISRMVEFKDYSNKELQDICSYMAKTSGYTLEQAAIEPLMDYVASLRKSKNYGNAREVRKVMESAIIAHSVRIMTKGTRKKDVLTADDVKKGIERLRKTPKNKTNFGFTYEIGEIKCKTR